MGWKNLPGNRPRKQHLGTADRNSAKKPAAGSNTKKQHPKVAPRSSAKKQGAENGNRTYLKRVNYLQISNYQLFRKIRLAPNFRFLATRETTSLLRECGRGGTGGTGRRIGFYRQTFHPTASRPLSEWLIINDLQKHKLALGASESTQAQMWFL